MRKTLIAAACLATAIGANPAFAWGPNGPPQELPQTSFGAAALIMEEKLGWRYDVNIDFVDENKARITPRPILMAVGQEINGHDIIFTRLDDCHFELRDFTSGLVAQLNFDNLTSEYNVSQLIQGSSMLSVTFIGSRALFCMGKAKLSSIFDKEINIQDNLCKSNLVIPTGAEAAVHILRAAAVVQSACPAQRAPF